MVELPGSNEFKAIGEVDFTEEAAIPIEDFLQPKAIEILEERRRKFLEEKQREEEKAAKEATFHHLRTSYKNLVLQTRERLGEEDDFCDSVFTSAILLNLEKIRQFAEEKNIYPGVPLGKPLDLLPQLFNIPERHTNTLSQDFEVSLYYTNEDELERQFKEQAQVLYSLHSYRKCGLKWGYKTVEERYSGEDGWGNSYFRTECFIDAFGIYMHISHNGEVTLNDLVFSRDELSSNRFRKALGDAFYSPKQNRRPYISSSDKYGENTENEDGKKISLLTRLKGRIIEISKSITSTWKKLWTTPVNDTKSEDSFLSKLWYGFPTQESAKKDENVDWGL